MPTTRSLKCLSQLRYSFHFSLPHSILDYILFGFFMYVISLYACTIIQKLYWVSVVMMMLMLLENINFPGKFWVLMTCFLLKKTYILQIFSKVQCSNRKKWKHVAIYCIHTFVSHLQAGGFFFIDVNIQEEHLTDQLSSGLVQLKYVLLIEDNVLLLNIL